MSDTKKKVAVLARLTESQNEFVEKLATERGDSKSSVIRFIVTEYQRIKEA
jgi:hypothetical protein